MTALIFLASGHSNAGWVSFDSKMERESSLLKWNPFSLKAIKEIPVDFVITSAGICLRSFAMEYYKQ
jgi:hypothetical protein